ncbi:MAG: hypothetical protein WD512_05675, partial [Candidatus Paceibacterota bacterium]
MKEILQKILKTLKIVSNNFKLFTSFGSKPTIVALAMIVCLSKVNGQTSPPVEALSDWTAGATKAKENGKNRMLVVVVGTEHSSFISADSIKYGGIKMTKLVEAAQGDTYREYSSIFTLNDAGITAADESGTITVSWSAALGEGYSISSAFYANVDQSVNPVDTFSTSGSSPLKVPAMNLGKGDLYILGTALANNFTSIDYDFKEELNQPKNSTVDGVVLKWGNTLIHSKVGTGVVDSANIVTSGGRTALT